MPIKLSQHQKRPPWLTRSNVLWGTGIALGLGVAIALVAALATGKLKSGIGGGETEVTSVKTTVGAVETTTTTTPQEAKTLWDWLSLAGIPLSLAGLGFWLQLKDQKIADKNRQQDLEIAQGTREEEALQHYLDRVSNLVIEKNLLAIAAKDAPTREEKELLDVSVEIIRALTLSTLRRLSDGIRKGSVVRLLIEAGIIDRLMSLEGADLQKIDLNGVYFGGAVLNNINLNSAKLSVAYLEKAELDGAKLEGACLEGANLNNANLTGANLTGADLTGAHLEGADLTKANLIKAELVRARLINANLSNAKLEGAKLEGAKLEGANLRDASLKGADLTGAYLEGADLRGVKGLTGEQLEKAWICQTKLPESIDIDSNRDCGTFHF
jgi:uncharacterized protein YjbI with pentapeptide repeats